MSETPAALEELLSELPGGIEGETERALSKWSSVATIIGLVLTIGGLVFSAGYQISKMRSEGAAISVTNTSKEVAVLKTDIALINQKLKSTEATLLQKSDEISKLANRVEEYEGESGVARVEIKHQIYLHAKDLCNRLNDSKNKISVCISEIDNIIECVAQNRASLDAPLIDACIRKKRKGIGIINRE